MPIITKYRSIKEEIRDLQAQLQKLENNSLLQKEREFEKKLLLLMTEYNKSLQDINEILSLKNKQPTKQVSTRRPRQLKRYKNPHTDELIETRGGNHKELKAWKAKWGADNVNNWVIVEE